MLGFIVHTDDPYENKFTFVHPEYEFLAAAPCTTCSITGNGHALTGPISGIRIDNPEGPISSMELTWCQNDDLNDFGGCASKYLEIW